MAEKLIVPTEVKVCATCSYWDGERRVDPEMQVVVVSLSCQGECLAQEEQKPGLLDAPRHDDTCIWEDLSPDGSDGTPFAPAPGAVVDHA